MSSRRWLLAFGLGLVLLGCGSSFESGSKLSGLRVLAIHKDKPYAPPGETVHLSMLLDDPRQAFFDGGPSARPPIEVAWLKWCDDPAADSFENCFSQFSDGGLPTGTTGGQGLDFSFELPAADAKMPDGKGYVRSAPGREPFGTSFVFFAACAGELKANPSKGTTPFGCFSQSGKALGADDFVVGYTEIFAYEKFTNHNPVIDVNPGQKRTGFQIDGCSVVPDCIGEDCIALERAELNLARSGHADAGVPEDGGVLDEAGVTLDGGTGGTLDGGSAPPPTDIACDGSDPRCMPACAEDDQNKCPKHVVDVQAAEDANVERDDANSTPGHQANEQMWINYYTDAGKLDHDVKLLSDATTGWNNKHSAELLAPKRLGKFHVWAVVHDNRGGTQWVRVTLATGSPYQEPVNTCPPTPAGG